MNTRNEYTIAYRAYRRWLQAVLKGTPQHIHIRLFNNIAQSYSHVICEAALKSLLAVKSLGAIE